MHIISAAELNLVSGGEQEVDMDSFDGAEFGGGSSWDGGGFAYDNGPIPTVEITGSAPSAFSNPNFWGMVGAFGAAILGVALAPEMVLVAGTVYVTAEVGAVIGAALVGIGGVGNSVANQ